jgi:hypothetical protein
MYGISYIVLAVNPSLARRRRTNNMRNRASNIIVAASTYVRIFIYGVYILHMIVIVCTYS